MTTTIFGTGICEGLDDVVEVERKWIQHLDELAKLWGCDRKGVIDRGRRVLQIAKTDPEVAAIDRIVRHEDAFGLR